MIGMAMALFAAALPNAVVLRPVVNMYSKPSEAAGVVSQAIYGANAALLEQLSLIHISCLLFQVGRSGTTPVQDDFVRLDGNPARFRSGFA